MTKKEFFFITIMAIAMVAMLAFGGTYAFFTASAGLATPNKTLTTAKVKLGAPTLTTIEADTKVVPGMPILKENNKITITNESDTEVWIFVKLTVYAEKGTPTAQRVDFKDINGDDVAEPFVVTYSEQVVGTDNFQPLTCVKTTADSKAVTGVYFAKVTSGNIDFADQITLSTSIHSESTLEGEGSVMSATIVINIETEAIQSYSLETAQDAYVALHSETEKA